MKKSRRGRFGDTLSEIISSLVFLVVGILFMLDALAYTRTENVFSAVVLFITSFACFCAVFRFVIAEAIDKYGKK